MATLLQDLRFGLRMLVAHPGFAIVALIAIALGIGANTAIFSVVNGVLLRPLPYKQPEKLAMVWLDNRRQGIHEDITSWPNFTDWRDQNRSFEGMAGYRTNVLNLTQQGEPEELRGARVTTNFFNLLGVSPALGRSFLSEEEAPGNERVAILSHGLWLRRFGANPSILNQQISLNAEQFTVIGVMPAGFAFPTNVELWSPLALDDRLRAARGSFWLPVIGRIKEGVSLAEAQADMKVIADRLEQQYPQINAGYGINVVPLHEQTVGNLRRSLMVLLGAVTFVLLIACANVANLLLARAAVREREIALRAALGAGRWRIIRQLLTESIVLSFAGGLLGVMLAWWGIDLFIRFAPQDIPRLNEISLDRGVLGFTLLLSIATGVVFGLVPALQATKWDLVGMLKEGARSGQSNRAKRIRYSLVVVEIALAVVLLACAGLLIRSFERLQRVDPGFRTDSILTVRLRLPRTKYFEGQQAVTFYQQLIDQLKVLPGVETAGATSGILLPKLATSNVFTVEGRPADPTAEQLELPIDAVTPDYFSTMGIELKSGRFFNGQDGPQTQRVGIINETMAKRYFPNGEAVGKRYTFGQPDSNTNWITVVGVVRDTRRQGLREPIRIESFTPHAQSPSRAMEIVIHTNGDPKALARSVRERIRTLDTDLPIGAMTTVEEMLSETLSQTKLNTLLLGAFAAIALILAAVGIYGLMSYAVSQRTQEMGVRIALGAESGDIVRLVVKLGMSLALAGLACGIVGAFVLTRFMRTLLYDTGTTDALTFVTVPLVLAAVALLACWIPARRATRVDPMVALRCE